MGCFVVAEFLLTGDSRGPSAIAEHLVISRLRIDVHDDDGQRRRRQRQRVTEGTAMASWNGPNHANTTAGTLVF